MLTENTEEDRKINRMVIDSELMKAVKARDKSRVQEALNKGQFSDSADPTNDALYYCILTSQYECASIILSHLSKFHDMILESTPLDRDTTTIILEYFGNVHDQIRFGWSKICQLGWINSMGDLKLLQLLIYHGPRNVIHRKSPDFGEHCFVSAIKNNAQNIIKILLCIYYNELGKDVLNSIKSDLNQSLQYFVNKTKVHTQKQQIFLIFEQYENNFAVLNEEVLSMILSDQFGKYKVLASYIKERRNLYPILDDYKFQKLVKEKSKKSKEKLNIYLSALQTEADAKKKEKEGLEQQPGRITYSDKSYFDNCLLQ